MSRIGRKGEIAYSTAIGERGQTKRNRKTDHYGIGKNAKSTIHRTQTTGRVKFPKKISGGQHTSRGQAKEMPKTIETQVQNMRKDGYEASAPPVLLICWRCGKIGHKKDCTAILFCTNCG